jgi:hypothetical protein
MFIKLLLAALLLIGTMVVMYRIQRRIRGEEGSAFIGGSDVKKKGKPANQNDLEQFVAAYRREKAQAGDSAAAASAPLAAAPSSLSAQAPVKARDVFLAGPAKVLFLVLRAGLPDHHIFANTRLADAIQLAGQPTTPQARAHYAQARIDFVVCNKDLAIVALIDLANGPRPDDVLKRALEPQFRNGGVRYLRLAPTAIPKPADARQLVYPD